MGTEEPEEDRKKEPGDRKRDRGDGKRNRENRKRESGSGRTGNETQEEPETGTARGGGAARGGA